MDLTCPQCNKQLPEVETLEYRFCPHCGAEVKAESGKLDDTRLTIPPDLTPPQLKQAPQGLSPQTGKQATRTESINDQTVEPQPSSTHTHTEIKPPDTPPPSGFFRVSAAEQAPFDKKKDFIEKPPGKKHRKLIIAVLILLAVIILILGGLFTF